ncbi:hypothetical protein ACTU6U_13525 [Microbacterium sp. A196]|uniref:hypothetical protein n=1 Tax=Microbacterium sp. A196 TaxID=3457320 RepID=UPI003FD5A4B8
MVDPKRARYIAGAEGAPPLPPPGGYQGARRPTAQPPLFPTAPLVNSAEATAEKQSAGAVGWIALVAAILFALTLLATLFGGGTDLLYGATMLVLQLVVVGVIIAALCSPRGRVLGASALVIMLLLNVATVGAMSALQTSASGSYGGQQTAEQRHAAAYPGVKDLSAAEVLAQPSLEEVRAESDAASAQIRQRLSDRFGYTWTQVGPEDLRPERNGYGGESMLVQYISVPWMTNEPVQDHDRKLEIMRVIEDVLVERGFYGMYSFNEPSSSLDDTILEKFYGTADAHTQHTWEWYTDNYPDPLRFYAVLFDLSNDPAGELRAERESDSAKTGEPLEGLRISFLAPQLLSEADREEFEERMREYPGY